MLHRYNTSTTVAIHTGAPEFWYGSKIPLHNQPISIGGGVSRPTETPTPTPDRVCLPSKKTRATTDGRRTELPASEACYSPLHILVTVSTRVSFPTTTTTFGLATATATVTVPPKAAADRLRDPLARPAKANELHSIKKVFLFALCAVLCCVACVSPRA
jgi:hypothetical protein